MESTLKIDIDIPELKKDKTLLQTWIQTRKAILEKLQIPIQKIRYTETQKGYHFWITINCQPTDKGICDLQFLLGDDQTRCRYNYLRLEAGCFKQFNVLFNKKLKNHNKKQTPLLLRLLKPLRNLPHPF
ncbi:MAG: hypothetical protein KIH10_16335 [Candidatus Freyarchaeota archaeon]|nr:hypothetical protein [Candidatus Jordarchaeia archaeon]MBS7281146.1 hypothetical protein [Candidatus Jordarchaeia archaeon]